MQFFGPIGMFFSVSGTAICTYLALEKFINAVDIGNRPLLLLGVLLLIIGIQFIGMGLLGEMIIRVYHESQKKPIYTIKKIFGSGR